MKNFAIIGVAGFVAPRHLQAIRATGNQLIAACDISDSVGIMDRYFSQADFFTSYERFERFLQRFIIKGKKLDYLVVCTPNHLHDTHIRLGLSLGADVICEKPVSINPWNVKALMQNENDSKSKVYNILQMRLHPILEQLKRSITPQKKMDVELTYLTSRGKWYFTSWKGDESKSGGVCVNIGIHFFDLLIHIFGEIKEVKMYQRSHDRASGALFFEFAKVAWYLSIDEDSLIQMENKNSNKSAYRGIKIEEQHFDFTTGFEDLHLRSYEEILAGNGFNLSDALPSISLVHLIRKAPLVDLDSDAHHLTTLPMRDHPFTR